MAPIADLQSKGSWILSLSVITVFNAIILFTTYNTAKYCFAEFGAVLGGSYNRVHAKVSLQKCGLVD